MPSIDYLVYASHLDRAKEEVTAAGGHLTHVLTPHLLVITLPDGIDVDSLQTVSEGLPQSMEPLEHVLAEGWTSRFGAESSVLARLEEAAAAPAIPWDSPGFEPPDPPPDAEGPGSVVPPSPKGDVSRSTGTPTSLYLTGTVAVGVVMVSGQAWTQVSGSLKHVSAGADGTVWGVNAIDDIVRRDGDEWTHIPGKLKQISVGSAANVWGVNAIDDIVRWDGGGWTHVPGKLKHVSAGSDGTVWGVNAIDDIVRYIGDNQWQHVPGQFKQISVGSLATIWGVDASDSIFTGNAASGLDLSNTDKAIIMAEVLAGLAFLASVEPLANLTFVYDWQDRTVNAVPGPSPSITEAYERYEGPWRNAALGAMGFVPSRFGSEQYVGGLRKQKETDWAFAAFFTKYPLHHFAYASDERLVMHYANGNWGPGAIDQVFAHEACHIFGAADEYGSCSCGGSGHYNISNNNCQNCTSAPLACLMNANTLQLCNWSRGQIGWSTWTQVSGSLKHVSAGADGTVWGVNAIDDIVRRDGGGWTHVPGKLKHVSAGSDGTVWGVNAIDDIVRRDGDEWTHISGKLKQISVGSAANVWGVNANDDILERSVLATP